MADRSTWFIGTIYIVLGAGVFAWGRWVQAALLKNAKRISLPAQRRHPEALLQRSGPKRVFVAVRVCGIAVMVVGGTLLLNR
jgi:hypothetical protein